MEIEKYYYPNEIVQESNSSRSLSFVVYDNGGLSMSVASAMKLAKDLGNKLLQKIPSGSTDIEGVLNTLKLNENISDDKIICTITLPLPNSFSDSQTHGWNSQKSLVGDIGSNLTSMNIADTSLTEFAGLVAGATSGVGVGDGVVKTVTGGVMGMIAGSAIRKTNISADSLLAQIANSTGQRKPIIDPGYFQNYSGSSPRSFSMKYDLVPKSTSEAKMILMIIVKFKQFSSPQQSGVGPILYSPFNFKIINENSYMNLLTSIDRVVLTSLSVDYGADGAMELFSDGMPKFISLTLTFSETRVRTSQDYSSIPQSTQKFSSFDK